MKKKPVVVAENDTVRVVRGEGQSLRESLVVETNVTDAVGAPSWREAEPDARLVMELAILLAELSTRVE